MRSNSKIVIFLLFVVIMVLQVAVLVVAGRGCGRDTGDQKDAPTQDSGRVVTAPPAQVVTPPTTQPQQPAAPVEQQPPATPRTPAVPQQPQQPVAVQPPAVTQPPSSSQQKVGMPPAYYNGFFKNAEKALPNRLATLVKEVRSGVVIDLDANAILWQKDAAKSYPIASLTKLMTSMLLMEYIDSHPGVSLNTQVTISSADRKYFRDKKINGVYLDAGEIYTLDEMLMCMMVCSANDCAYVVSRYISQDRPEEFPATMNRRARELGLNGMNFLNPHGLPVVAQKTRKENTGSALEVAYLAIRDMHYAAIRKWAATTQERIRADKKNPFDVNSTNKLLRGKVPGVNGMKTGFTDGAGYCIVVTCTRQGKNRMVVLMGVQGSDRGKRRDEIAKQILEWSYQE
jgi:D-alanyl-D-alanine carboxypeptidase